ncbi:hypothetical protein Agub_g5356 [Astrephomene gubernaculifera]|uniref:Uncharacterized protein n=1 Tax=Astrephomene gubernaculifera TaxID=47775 RepID=A0AAD3HKQ5_9CHLO|nr:hypothetical protein Agub_g5356 [Astrephomene gubernaculifera]
MKWSVGSFPESRHEAGVGWLEPPISNRASWNELFKSSGDLGSDGSLSAQLGTSDFGLTAAQQRRHFNAAKTTSSGDRLPGYVDHTRQPHMANPARKFRRTLSTSACAALPCGFEYSSPAMPNSDDQCSHDILPMPTPTSAQPQHLGVQRNAHDYLSGPLYRYHAGADHNTHGFPSQISVFPHLPASELLGRRTPVKSAGNTGHMPFTPFTAPQVHAGLVPPPLLQPQSRHLLLQPAAGTPPPHKALPMPPYSPWQHQQHCRRQQQPHGHTAAPPLLQQQQQQQQAEGPLEGSGSCGNTAVIALDVACSAAATPAGGNAGGCPCRAAEEGRLAATAAPSPALHSPGRQLPGLSGDPPCASSGGSYGPRPLKRFLSMDNRSRHTSSASSLSAGSPPAPAQHTPPSARAAAVPHVWPLPAAPAPESLPSPASPAPQPGNNVPARPLRTTTSPGSAPSVSWGGASTRGASRVESGCGRGGSGSRGDGLRASWEGLGVAEGVHVCPPQHEQHHQEQQGRLELSLPRRSLQLPQQQQQQPTVASEQARRLLLSSVGSLGRLWEVVAADGALPQREKQTLLRMIESALQDPPPPQHPPRQDPPSGQQQQLQLQQQQQLRQSVTRLQGQPQPWQQEPHAAFPPPNAHRINNNCSSNSGLLEQAHNNGNVSRPNPMCDVACSAAVQPEAAPAAAPATPADSALPPPTGQTQGTARAAATTATEAAATDATSVQHHHQHLYYQQYQYLRRNPQLLSPPAQPPELLSPPPLPPSTAWGLPTTGPLSRSRASSLTAAGAAAAPSSFHNGDKPYPQEPARSAAAATAAAAAQAAYCSAAPHMGRRVFVRTLSAHAAVGAGGCPGSPGSLLDAFATRTRIVDGRGSDGGASSSQGGCVVKPTAALGGGGGNMPLPMFAAGAGMQEGWVQSVDATAADPAVLKASAATPTASSPGTGLVLTDPAAAAAAAASTFGIPAAGTTTQQGGLPLSPLAAASVGMQGSCCGHPSLQLSYGSPPPCYNNRFNGSSPAMLMTPPQLQTQQQQQQPLTYCGQGSHEHAAIQGCYPPFAYPTTPAAGTGAPVYPTRLYPPDTGSTSANHAFSPMGAMAPSGLVGQGAFLNGGHQALLGCHPCGVQTAPLPRVCEDEFLGSPDPRVGTSRTVVGLSTMQGSGGGDAGLGHESDVSMDDGARAPPLALLCGCPEPPQPHPSYPQLQPASFGASMQGVPVSVAMDGVGGGDETAVCLYGGASGSGAAQVVTGNASGDSRVQGEGADVEEGDDVFLDCMLDNMFDSERPSFTCGSLGEEDLEGLLHPSMATANPDLENLW